MEAPCRRSLRTPASRSRPRWVETRDCASSVIAVSSALASLAFAAEVLVLVAFGVAVPLLAALAVAARRSRVSREPWAEGLTKAVWPDADAPSGRRSAPVRRRNLRRESKRHDQRSVGERLDEVDARHRQGEITDAERLALRDEIITLRG